MSSEEATPEALDRHHIAILAALQADARLSNAELARRIGLSAAPTWRKSAPRSSDAKEASISDRQARSLAASEK